jgi:hypothetical protein
MAHPLGQLFMENSNCRSNFDHPPFNCVFCPFLKKFSKKCSRYHLAGSWMTRNCPLFRNLHKISTTEKSFWEVWTTLWFREKWRFGKTWKTAKNYLKLAVGKWIRGADESKLIRKSNLELSKTLKFASTADKLRAFPVIKYRGAMLNRFWVVFLQ